MKKLLISLAILAFASFAVAVTQTGNLIVSVMSEEGQILPGATVTVTSPVLMGARVQTTAANGKATFRNLPPGDYTVEVTMDGFQTFRQGGIEIRIVKTSKIDVSLKLGQAREVIEVVGTGPIVDTSSNAVGAEFDFSNYINHMPTYRHYTSVMSLAGGVVGGNNPNTGGGGTYSNVYMIDGTVHMDPRTHTWSGQFNIDTTADMNLIIAGAPAEFGHGQGGIMNIVTKSGSNEITAIGRYEMWRSAWNDTNENNPARTDDSTKVGFEGGLFNISGGGPLYPDMFWWYIGYSKYTRYRDLLTRRNPMDEGEFSHVYRTYYGSLFNIKGTAQIGSDLKVQGFYREDPINIYNVNSSPAGYFLDRVMPEFDQVQKQGGKGYMASASMIVSDTMFVEAAWTGGRNNLDVIEQGNDPNGEWTASKTTGPSYISSDGWFWGCMPQYYDSERNHDLVRGALNYLLQTDSMGDHDIKFGVEWLDNWTSQQAIYYPGNEVITTSPLTNVGFDNVRWTYRYTYENRRSKTEDHAKYWTVYLQDSIQVMDSLTVNLGLRTDFSYLYDNLDTEIHSDGIFTALAPRIGFAYDLSGSVIRGFVGRYYDQWSNYLIEDFKVYENKEILTAWEPTDKKDGRNGWTKLWSYVDPDNTLNPDITPQYMDEATLGFDWLISDTMAVSIDGIYRRWMDGIAKLDPEDDLSYYWTNLTTEEYGSKWKQYLGFIVDFRKRPTDDNLFLNASFTYQKTEGLTLSPIGYIYGYCAYMNEDRVTSYWGDLNGNNWFAKAQATYFFPNNWYLGVQANWIQGIATSSFKRIQYIADFGWLTYFPNGRADLDRLPDQFTVDIQFGIEQPIELPWDVPLWDDTILLGIYLDVFNVLDWQGAITMDGRIGRATYAKATKWFDARNYELGFRIEL